MPALKNPKQEAFCQGYVRGENAGNATKCYLAAYGRKDSAAASRLQRQDSIIQRVAELQGQVTAITVTAQAKALQARVIDEQWIVDRLVESVERAMQHEPVRDSEGRETGEYKFDGRTATKALELLGKYQGMFIERRVTVHEYADKSDAQLRAELEQLAELLRDSGIDLGIAPAIQGPSLGATAAGRTH